MIVKLELRIRQPKPSKTAIFGPKITKKYAFLLINFVFMIKYLF